MGLADTLREVFISIGVDADAASFATAMLAVDGLHAAAELLVEGFKMAVEGVHEMIASTAEAAESIELLAQRTGIETKTLQEFGYAASLSNISMEDLAIGLGHLAKTGVKDLHAGLLDLADKFQKMPDGGAKTALAMEKFGRAGARMIPFLNKGREGLAELAAEADELGIVMDETFIKNGTEYAENQKKMNASLTGLKYAIVGPLLKGSAEFLKTLRGWISASRGLLQYVGYLKVAVIAFASVALGLAIKSLIAYTAAAIAAGTVSEAFGIAALIAGVKAAGAGLLAIAPWVALGALLILVADEIITTFRGGDSELRRFSVSWTKFITEWTKPRDSDPWWLMQIRMFLRALTDVEETWNRFARLFSGSELEATLNAFGIKSGGQIIDKATVASGPAARVFGPAVGPLPASGNSASSNFQATINVDASNVRNAEDIGPVIRATLDKWHGDKMKATIAAVQ